MCGLHGRAQDTGNDRASHRLRGAPVLQGFCKGVEAEDDVQKKAGRLHQLFTFESPLVEMSDDAVPEMFVTGLLGYTPCCSHLVTCGHPPHPKIIVEGFSTSLFHYYTQCLITV